MCSLRTVVLSVVSWTLLTLIRRNQPVRNGICQHGPHRTSGANHLAICHGCGPGQ